MGGLRNKSTQWFNQVYVRGSRTLFEGRRIYSSILGMLEPLSFYSKKGSRVDGGREEKNGFPTGTQEGMKRGRVERAITRNRRVLRLVQSGERDGQKVTEGFFSDPDYRKFREKHQITSVTRSNSELPKERPGTRESRGRTPVTSTITIIDS